MDQVQAMMEGLAINESSFHEYADLKYEFDAYQFYDFSVDETDYEVEEAERWFRYARGYPPAPYIFKIKLTDLSKSAPAKVQSKPEADEHVSSSTVTLTDFSISSPEKKTEADSDLKYHNLFADDDHIVKAKSKSANKLSKPNRTFMKPTASHLAKQINLADVNEGTKRQKLEIGFLRKVAKMKHETPLSHKMTSKATPLEASSNSRSKTTIPRKPKLMTEERARKRRSRSKPEVNIYAFKALPLNRKIFESPLLPMRKKSTPYSPEFEVLNTHNTVSSVRGEVIASKRSNSFLPCVFHDQGPF